MRSILGWQRSLRPEGKSGRVSNHPGTACHMGLQQRIAHGFPHDSMGVIWKHGGRICCSSEHGPFAAHQCVACPESISLSISLQGNDTSQSTLETFSITLADRGEERLVGFLSGTPRPPCGDVFDFPGSTDRRWTFACKRLSMPLQILAVDDQGQAPVKIWETRRPRSAGGGGESEAPLASTRINGSSREAGTSVGTP